LLKGKNNLKIETKYLTKIQKYSKIFKIKKKYNKKYYTYYNVIMILDTKMKSKLD
jgi:hypothetical protein